MSIPASIRSNNPGAMWGKGNAIAAKWGSTHTENLADGLGQGNNIAHFPNKVDGAAAQFDLWREHYTGMTLHAAITRWSGGNWSQPYADFLTKHTGLSMQDQITPEVLASPKGLALMKFQAQWEAGQPYPMTDEEWAQAQALVFQGQTQTTQAASTAPVAPQIVRIGDSGAIVAKMQTQLGVKATGTYSERSETEFALRLFQVRSGLTPDGVCGNQTWAKLNMAKGVVG